nr:hypothetical protein [Thioalkalivibrio sp.]
MSPTPRAEERSVIRHTAFVPPRRLRQRWRQMADDGLRPFPPYASLINRGCYTATIVGAQPSLECPGSRGRLILVPNHGVSPCFSIFGPVAHGR